MKYGGEGFKSLLPQKIQLNTISLPWDLPGFLGAGKGALSATLVWERCQSALGSAGAEEEVLQ